VNDVTQGGIAGPDTPEFTLVPGAVGQAVATGLITAGNINDPTTRERPAPNGFSIGHPDITAGTLGAIVTDGTDLFILSNNHVLANSNDANIGDPSLQPGPADGGTSADQIATLADFVPITFSGNNTLDAAISLVNGADITAVTPSYAYGAPGTTTASVSPGDGVQKFGRTTGHTTGVVAETNVTVDICYVPRGPFRCAQSARFVNQFTISDGSFSAGGDSGSLIVTNNAAKNSVGLLFAGSSTRTIANPIDEALAVFGVTIATDPGSGGGDTPPSVSVTSPSNGAVVSGTVSLTANATDDNAVTQVEFFVDGASVGTDTDGSNGWSASWNSQSVSDGTYEITAEATDDNSQATTSAAISVDVDNVDSPPTVTVTSPADGATVSGTVSIMADASDDNLVTQVEFFVDGGSIGTDTDGSDGWSASWDTSGETNGSPHTITAEATDDAAQTDSDQISVTVDNSAPTTMSVGDLSSTSINEGSTWDALVTITIVDSNGNPVAGATVSGSWSGAGSGSGACAAATDSNGQCTVTRTGMRKRNGSVTYTLDGVAHASLTYDETANVETSIVVSKP
jgi:hypothetical protein